MYGDVQTYILCKQNGSLYKQKGQNRKKLDYAYDAIRFGRKKIDTSD